MAIYKKTSKGMSEVLAREPSIDPRLLSVLILVDGTRDSSEIREMAKATGLPLDGLDILVYGGYLEQKLKGSPTPVQKSLQADTAPSFPRPAAGNQPLKGFQDFYAFMVEQTKSQLGFRGFTFQLRIERAATLDGLQALIEPLSDAIEKRHGPDVAEAFRQQSELLGAVAAEEQKYVSRQTGAKRS